MTRRSSKAPADTRSREGAAAEPTENRRWTADDAKKVARRSRPAAKDARAGDKGADVRPRPSSSVPAAERKRTGSRKRSATAKERRQSRTSSVTKRRSSLPPEPSVAKRRSSLPPAPTARRSTTPPATAGDGAGAPARPNTASLPPSAPGLG
ncbi:MAG: hypothetical protein KC543_12215, partial [Myxococcales bacterium]|nr:hypothetical protein [Myxococcales bacterium]